MTIDSPLIACEKCGLVAYYDDSREKCPNCGNETMVLARSVI